MLEDVFCLGCVEICWFFFCFFAGWCIFRLLLILLLITLQVLLGRVHVRGRQLVLFARSACLGDQMSDPTCSLCLNSIWREPRQRAVMTKSRLHHGSILYSCEFFFSFEICGHLFFCFLLNWVSRQAPGNHGYHKFWKMIYFRLSTDASLDFLALRIFSDFGCFCTVWWFRVS